MLLAGMLVLTITGRSIGRTVAGVHRSLDALADGDLTVPTPVTSADEIGKMAEAELKEVLVVLKADVQGSVDVLRNEIVSRYHFQTGRAKAAMTTDPYIRKAVEVLNGNTYPEILAGTGNAGR